MILLYHKQILQSIQQIRGILTMLPTNSILSKDYVRENVVSATLVAVENNSLLLKTNAVIKNFAKASSDDDEMFARMKESAQGEVATGRLLIEVFKQDCLRVRFFKGEEIGENNTPKFNS